MCYSVNEHKGCRSEVQTLDVINEILKIYNLKLEDIVVKWISIVESQPIISN